MTPPMAVAVGRELVASYGSFLFFARLAPNLLLVACTLLDPWAGLLGLAAGLVTLLTRRVLSLPSAGGMEGGNGMLAGLFLGGVFAPSWASAVLAVAAGPLTMMVALFASDLLARGRLPLLSGAFVPVAWLLTGVGHALALPPRVWPAEAPVDWLALPVQDFLRAVGGI
ncbi:MAG: urea transporter, partial [Alphaproteobacteria bacterium]|nr:urea transporter [Alphaproteobacteria bacterium]